MSKLKIIKPQFSDKNITVLLGGGREGREQVSIEWKEHLFQACKK